MLQFADEKTANALFSSFKDFEKVYDYIVEKTEAMWIGSQKGCEDQPFVIKWQTCDKFLRIHITYGVKILLKKNFKQTLKKIRNTINLWKVRQRAVYLP